MFSQLPQVLLEEVEKGFRVVVEIVIGVGAMHVAFQPEGLLLGWNSIVYLTGVIYICPLIAEGLHKKHRHKNVTGIKKWILILI
jgi:hypothetical protein